MAVHYESCMNTRPQTRQAMLETLLILVPNISQGKCYFCVLKCCTGSAVYFCKAAFKLELNILRSEVHFLLLKQISF